MYKKILLGGYYGFENLGDELILGVITRFLMELGVEPVILSNAPESTQRQYQAESILRTDVQQIFQKMREVDAFIIGGGGLFQDVTGIGSPIYYGGLMELAHWCRKPTAFFAQGVGPLNGRLGKMILRRELNHCSLIVVRDARSQTMIQPLVRQPVHLSADPVWLMKFVGQDLPTHQGAVGLSLRPWPSLTDDVLQRLSQCLLEWPDIHARGVHFIDCHAGQDIAPLGKIEQVLKAHRIPVQWFYTDHVVEGISQCHCILAMRFHAVLVAALVGIPSVVFSYDPKVSILADQLGLKVLSEDRWAGITQAELMDSVGLASRPVIDKYRMMAMNGFKQLQAWVEGHSST